MSRVTRALAVLAVLAIAVPAVAGDTPITALSTSPDAQQIVAASVEELRVLDAASLTTVQKLEADLEQIHAVQFSPDRKHLAAVGGVPGETGEIELYSWPGTERIGRWDPAVDVLYGLDWSADGQSLVAVGFDETAWRVSLPEPQLSQWDPGHSRPITAVCLLPNPDSEGRQHLAVTAGVDRWQSWRRSPMIERCYSGNRRPDG